MDESVTEAAASSSPQVDEDDALYAISYVLEPAVAVCRACSRSLEPISASIFRVNCLQILQVGIHSFIGIPVSFFSFPFPLDIPLRIVNGTTEWSRVNVSNFRMLVGVLS